MDTHHPLNLVELMCSLQRQLLLAREQKNQTMLRDLMCTFDVIEGAALEVHDKSLAALAEDLVCSARDSLMGVDWKSTIASEEDIRLLLANR